MKNAKFIFVTGGVVSSLGKGIISSSIGRLLLSCGYKVTIQKFDPYINIDPGTLNPYEHGECDVTEDGVETDLDLGHYERFTGIHTTVHNSVTTGKVYQSVIEKERRGDYLGKTIQVVPHITDEIKDRIRANDRSGEFDFIITEIGGTIGDIESAPFLEAIRQLRWELGQDSLCIHLTYVPYLSAAGEVKTKPTQHSVKELQSLGIQPDILILRTEKHLRKEILQKVAAFCNVAPGCVVQSEDLPSIYEVPLNMHRQGLDQSILAKFGMNHLEGHEQSLTQWEAFVRKEKELKTSVKVGLVGKYDLQDAYKSIRESLHIAGIHIGKKVDIVFVNSETLNAGNVEETLSGFDGVVICPGFGSRGTEGKMEAVTYSRTHGIPTFGICLGMQMMVIEFARKVLGYKDANSSEIDPDTPHKVIDLMESQKALNRLGGTMRLGAYPCTLEPGSRVRKIYGADCIRERHRHRYEFNNDYLGRFEQAGMLCPGRNPESQLVEIIELPEHKWFIGTQFHPEYSSTVLSPHPLFLDFVRCL